MSCSGCAACRSSACREAMPWRPVTAERFNATFRGSVVRRAILAGEAPVASTAAAPLLARRVLAVMPALTPVGVWSQVASEYDVDATASSIGCAITATRVSSRPDVRRAMAGGFHSHAFRLQWVGYLDFTRFEYTTYMRIWIPTGFSADDAEYLGVVFVAEPDQEAAVEWDETANKCRMEAEVLASGFAWYEVQAGRLGADFQDLPTGFMDGPPMVVVTFTRPGRGNRVGWSATGDSRFRNTTPENTNGEDYGGELTITYMNAVMDVTLAIVADCFGDVTTRLVMLSESIGFPIGARWVAQAPWAVHAHVNWEGPADSFDAMGTVTPVPEGTWPPPSYFSGNYAEWEAGFGNLLVFRPPLQLLDLDSGSWLPGAGETILGGWLEYWAFLAFFGWSDEAGWLSYWQEYYWQYGTHRADADAWLRDFWEEREAIHHLEAGMPSGCAFVRIQSSYDHSQPSWVNGWNGVKALNAAFSGGNSNTYYSRNTMWDALHGVPEPATNPLAAPTQMKALFDEGDLPPDPDPDVSGESAYTAANWPYWLPDMGDWTDNRWPVIVHCVRWAMGRVFLTLSPGPAIPRL